MSHRDQLATFINIGTVNSPDWSLLGEGITTGAINWNAQTVEETYIHQRSGTTEVESYRPTFPVEAKHIESDEAIEYLSDLMWTRPTLEEAHTQIVNVRLYETPEGGEYPAELQDVGLQFDTFGGDAGTRNVMNFVVNYRGDPVAGTYNPESATFTPVSE
jgi:hypothetical protein